MLGRGILGIFRGSFWLRMRCDGVGFYVGPRNLAGTIHSTVVPHPFIPAECKVLKKLPVICRDMLESQSGDEYEKSVGKR
jgi:hypothetical protein